MSIFIKIFGIQREIGFTGISVFVVLVGEQ